MCSHEAPPSCSSRKRKLHHIITKVSTKHIPRGHIPKIIHNLSYSAKPLIRQLDHLRSHSTIELLTRTLDEQTYKDIQDTNRQIWVAKVVLRSHKYNTSQYFSLLRRLSGKCIAHFPDSQSFCNAKLSPEIMRLRLPSTNSSLP